MKHLMNCLVASTAVLAFAQGRLVFKDKRNDPSLQIEGNKGMIEPDSRFELEGNVIIRQPKEGFVMTCATAKGDLVKVNIRDVNGKTVVSTEFDNVKLTGTVKINQSVTSGSSEFTCASADYNLDGALRKIKFNGGIKLVHKGSTAAKQGFTVTGSSANATLRKKGQNSDISTATVNGPIVFDGSEVYKTPSGSQLRQVAVKSDSLTYTRNDDDTAQMVLRGNIDLKQSTAEDDGPEISGAQTITLDLNVQGNVTRIRMSAGGGDIKTVYKKKGNA